MHVIMIVQDQYACAYQHQCSIQISDFKLAINIEMNINMHINIERWAPHGGFAPKPPRLRRDRIFQMPRHPKKDAMRPPHRQIPTRSHSQTAMAFNARLLGPWEPAFVEFDTVEEYDAWMTKIGGEPLKSTTAERLLIWMSTAKVFDTLWLNEESDQCPAESAEIQLTRKQ